MYTFMSNESKWGALLRGFLVALLLAGSGVASAATFDLWAKAGTTTLPGGATVNVWGYTTGLTGATDLVTLPGGPTLIVNQGDTVVVNLTNNLTAATAMYFQGQSIVPDTTGAAASGGTKTYTFTATDPGTYLYEAGLLPNSQHQAAMGLHGALIVRPATVGQAYNDAVTAYNDEAVLVLSEIDPALHANPAAFDMRNYAPKYFLINGKAYPATDPITSVAGNKVLLRYVNAGIQHRSMAVLGLRQNFVAKDAGLLPTLNQNVVAETLAPGQTGDAIAIVPAAGQRFAVYDGSLKLHNSNLAGFGGMLTFVTAGAGTAIPGPLVTAISLSTDLATLTATITASSGQTLAAAEYWVDAGMPTAISGAFTTQSETVTASIPAQPAGNHTIFVRGKDNAGTWGATRSIPWVLDTLGPNTTGLTLTPNPSNGSVAVALHATGNDTTMGGSNIAAAEYFIGTVGANGTGFTMTVNVAAPVASVDAIIAPPVTGGTISVHSKDAKGNWGAFATIVLNVVGAVDAPVTSAVSASRNPNNGALPLNASQPVVRVTATMTSAGSTISAAEGFIDVVGANGTGFVFVPSDGAWSSATESAFGDIPLATINLLTAGNHTIHVRGKDAAGNWGGTSTTTLVIDKAAPSVSGLTLTPPASNNSAVVISATASDAATGNSNIVAAEYFIDGVGATGTGAGMTFIAAPAASLSASIAAPAVTALTTGNHTVYVRAKDAAGNWSATTSVTLLIDRQVPTFTSITLTSPPATINVGGSMALSVNGSTDPLVAGLASGVVGGEYWIGTTNIAAGTGTPFTGLTSSVDTSTLAGGTHTVRVRIRDAAGNWSTVVRTATLLVIQVVNDALNINSNTSTTPQTSNGNVLTNDLPNVAGRIATLVSGPVRTDATGNAGTISVTCVATSAFGVCTNGAYRVTLTPVGATGALRQVSKRGTYQFTYTETLNGVTTPPATVTITVN